MVSEEIKKPTLYDYSESNMLILIENKTTFSIDDVISSVKEVWEMFLAKDSKFVNNDVSYNLNYHLSNVDPNFSFGFIEFKASEYNEDDDSLQCVISVVDRVHEDEVNSFFAKLLTAIKDEISDIYERTKNFDTILEKMVTKLDG